MKALTVPKRRVKHGRHPDQVLSTKKVQELKNPGRYGDGGGLYLEVGPNGSKSWILRTVVMGTRRDLGLGSTSLVSLPEARKEASRLRKIARAGGDPLSERKHSKVPSFEQAARQVHSISATTFKNEKHRKQWLTSLNSAFLSFGEKRVDSITPDDINVVLGPRWETHPETSRRVLQRIKKILAWSKIQGFRTGDNPASDLASFLPPRHNTQQSPHPALPYQDLPGFIWDLRASKSNAIVKLALEYLILCAARTGEVLGALWDEVDFETKTWTITARRRINLTVHRIPLSPRCVEILEQVREYSGGGPYVFPGRRGNKPLSDMAFLVALRRMGRNDITPYGFRSTFRDWAVEQTSFPAAVCEAALAHRVRYLTESQPAGLFDRRRQLMQLWSAPFVSRKQPVAMEDRLALEANRLALEAESESSDTKVSSSFIKTLWDKMRG